MIYANLFFVRLFIAAVILIIIGCIIAYKCRNTRDGGGALLFITFGIVIAMIAGLFMAGRAG